MPYGTHLCLIGKFGAEGTLPGLIAIFRRGVLERKLTESDCTVLLATACGAKGLEWDSVKVLDDFTRLMSFEPVPEEELRPGSDYAKIYHGGAPPPSGGQAAPSAAGVSHAPPMRFNLVRDWKGDELNSWYVAITRARQRLELPPRFWHLYRAVWLGEGFSPDPDDKNSPEYTPGQIAGINELLGRMGQALPPAGPEMATLVSPPTPATAQAASLAHLQVAPQILQFG